MKLSRIVALLLLIFAIYYSFKSLMPSSAKEPILNSSFSIENASKHVEALALQPHYVGSKGHTQVKDYLVGALHQMNLKTTIQEGVTAGDWGNLSEATNIITKIEGSEEGKALLLLSHYDSSPHSSYGASDAASGVATVLEGVRSFLEEGKTPKNDIIIVFTDAEELGLNGASLFVNKHPWIKNVGLVLNFEARGSGGPSYMLIETNRGNAKLIKEFTKANPEYPVTNSLAYSIYKMLPNDTDLTVFREDADIEGFNFAFIDDHYDYHTALDTHERLDKTTLLHQGTYLVPLLQHFGNANLDDLKSLNDSIYFNVPLFKLITYPFEWIWPMFILSVAIFIGLLIIGFKRKVLSFTAILKGFIPLLLILSINGIIGYVTWPILKWWYPGYEDMLHRFTYNGHAYILEMAFLALAICFFVYNKFKKITTPNLLVVPIFIWLLICGLTATYLRGASFFIIPVFGLIAAFMVCLYQNRPQPILLLFFTLPGIFILTPFLKMFPVGLGLNMIITTTLLLSLLYLIVLPLFKQIKKPTKLTVFSFLLFIVFGIVAHLNSGFTEDRPKPSSLLYVHDADTNSAQWATYDKKTIPWNTHYLGKLLKPAVQEKSTIISSKYGTGFSFVKETTPKPILPPNIEVAQDTIVGSERLISLCVVPQRNVNRLDVYTNDILIYKAEVNSFKLSDYFLENRRNGKLITHFITDNRYTEIKLSIPKDESLTLKFFEASNDLLTNSLFSVPERPKNSIPMPFVLNDAILITKTITFD